MEKFTKQFSQNLLTVSGYFVFDDFLIEWIRLAIQRHVSRLHGNRVCRCFTRCGVDFSQVHFSQEVSLVSFGNYPHPFFSFSTSKESIIGMFSGYLDRNISLSS